MPEGEVVIEASDNSAENFYVKELTLNGASWNHNYLLQKDLQKGAKLHFKMASEPNCKRGTANEDKPPLNYNTCHGIVSI